MCSLTFRNNYTNNKLIQLKARHEQLAAQENETQEQTIERLRRQSRIERFNKQQFQGFVNVTS